MKKNLSFSLRGPDRVSEELATVLSKKGSWEFKTLFDVVHANLRSKDFARGGEEMLRLRAHEKLQNFVQTGVVKKTGKVYVGIPKALQNYFKTTAELKARIEEVRQSRALPGGGTAAFRVVGVAEAVKATPPACKASPKRKVSQKRKAPARAR